MYLLQLSTNIHGSVQGKDWRRSLHWNNRSERTFCRLSHRVNIRFGIGWPLGANNRKARSSALSIFFISGGCTCSGWCVISRGSDEVFRPFMRLRIRPPPSTEIFCSSACVKDARLSGACKQDRVLTTMLSDANISRTIIRLWRISIAVPCPAHAHCSDCDAHITTSSIVSDVPMTLRKARKTLKTCHSWTLYENDA